MISSYIQAQRELEALPSIAEYMDRKKHPAAYLQRTQMLLKELKHPERGFSVIHIGGTAGKGSVTMFLHYILAASDKKVGAFISPHVTTAVERTLIDTRPISTKDFVWAWEKVKKAITRLTDRHGHNAAPSYFEAQYAMSLLLFHKYHVRWITLEVGCGGEFDATNTIPAPRATIITNIHLDHMQLLGKTRAQIAKTKSGIIKSKSVIFTGEINATIRRIIENCSQKARATCRFVKKPTYPISIHTDQMEWQHPNLGKLSSHLLGSHQLHNAEIAIAVAQYLKLPKKAIKNGIAKTRIPARSEIMQHKPIVLIDGAHNPAKVESLVRLLRSFNVKKKHAVIGIGHNKQICQMLHVLIPQFAHICFTNASLEDPKPASAHELLRIAQNLYPKKKFLMHTDPLQAYKKILTKSHPQDLIVVTGSLYLSGEIRTRWIPESNILKTHNLFLS
ncbi:MAG: Mur ligase family protein [Patescibacteria group bacterium]|jgi:dihydrofolate synthase/folylpolyglutamate synthase